MPFGTLGSVVFCKLFLSDTLRLSKKSGYRLNVFGNNPLRIYVCCPPFEGGGICVAAIA